MRSLSQSLFSREINMNSEKTINLDNVTMHRALDGTVTISPKQGSGCVNIGLLIATAIVALLAGVVMVNGVIQSIKPGGGSEPGVILFGLIVTFMFGGYAYYLYSKMHSGQKQAPLAVSPILNVIRTGDRTIPFNEIADVSAEGAPAIIEGAGVAKFQFVLSNGTTLYLGQVTTDTEKLDQRKAEIITFLKIVIKQT